MWHVAVAVALDVAAAPRSCLLKALKSTITTAAAATTTTAIESHCTGHCNIELC